VHCSSSGHMANCREQPCPDCSGGCASSSTGPFQLWSVCSSCETKTLTTCLFPRASTCSFPKMMVQVTFSIVSQEKVRRPEGQALRPLLPLHSPRGGASLTDPIWSSLRLPSVHSVMLIPNRACVLVSVGDSPIPTLENCREAAISIRRMIERTTGPRGLQSPYVAFQVPDEATKAPLIKESQ
uniref:Uncharacterized protein n=2 Tax=Theropithecus gelada TaxID=9565 RepID=A0A8D2EJU7_THEGE